jgi:hypothetical protein
VTEISGAASSSMDEMRPIRKLQVGCLIKYCTYMITNNEGIPVPGKSKCVKITAVAMN